MKYECDMVKDLMPLCIDGAATKASEKVVLSHVAECKSCEEYFQLLQKDVPYCNDEQESTDKFILLAKRLRKRNILIRGLVLFLVAVWFLLCINYAAGYRLNPSKAADICGRLNTESQVLGSYEWKDTIFYFYDNYSCYDVIAAKSTWHGYKAWSTSLSWPKWYEDHGIQMVGNLCYWEKDEFIQLFPVVVKDPLVKSIEVTVFGQTKSTNVEQNELTLLTFVESDNYVSNAATATAYDGNGNPVYTLCEYKGYLVWKPVE